MNPIRAPRQGDDREHVDSNEDGKVTFNYLQQRDPSLEDKQLLTPLEEASTTDPWGVVP